MSQHHIVELACPRCGQKTEFTVWDSINTALDPEMKEKVCTGEAFFFRCPNCVAKTFVDYATLYHQMEDHVMIWLMPGNPSEGIEQFESIKNGKAGIPLYPDYYLRVVTSRYQLREKLLLLDWGWDDRFAEIAKLFSHEAIRIEHPELSIEELLFDQADDGKVCLGFRLTDGRWGYLPFDYSLYKNVKEKWEDKLPKEDAYVIDSAWAQGVIEKEAKRFGE